MDQVLPPAPNPCGSCPYRRDVPSGIWDKEEYELLPQFDRLTYEQPARIFLCHQQNGRLCSGWAGCHDMINSLGFRIAVSRGDLDLSVVEYTTSTPLFASGQEARDHGMRDYFMPGSRARNTVSKLLAKRSRKQPE